jgi:hypothetical protein
VEADEVMLPGSKRGRGGGGLLRVGC